MDANNTSNTAAAAAAINAAAAAISSSDSRHTSPGQSRWKSFWSGLWCFRSQKRDIRIVPASRLDTASGSARGWPPNGPAQAGLALAPPSSPASFVHSSVQSPSNYSLSLSVASANVCSPPPNPMFTIGPYAHETQLVSPPVFSTFTTEPSTAPFTPPPELAHVTTPSSPDVPFAQLLASSLEAKASVRDTVSPFSGSSLASPADIPTGELQTTYQLYPGSPVSHLVSPTSGISICGSGTSSPTPVIEFPAQLNALRSSSFSSFPKFEPFTSLANDQPPCTMITLPLSLEPESQQSLTLFGANGQRDSVDCHSDLRSDAEPRVEIATNMAAAGTDDNYSTFLNRGIDNVNEAVDKIGEEHGQSIKGERALNGFLLKGHPETNWELFHVDFRKECLGRSLESGQFCNNHVEDALTKKENKGAKKWVQQVERPLERAVDLNTSECADIEAVETVSQHPQGPQHVPIRDCSNEKTKNKTGSDPQGTNEWVQQVERPLERHAVDPNTSKCADIEAIETLSQHPQGLQHLPIPDCSNEKTKDKTGSDPHIVLEDKFCHVRKSDHPCYGSKHTIGNETNTCRCGDLTIHSSELSAAWEHAKGKLADYEVSIKAVENQNKEQENIS